MVVGEPGSYYLTHLTPEDGKALSIALAVYSHIDDTELVDKLKVIGTDGTPTMTGAHGGCIRHLEVLLNRPLQWSICLLHMNELPLRHVFTALDGRTHGPGSFNGPIGKQVCSTVSDWPVVNFTPIINSEFPVLSSAEENDLSTDQNYAYRIAIAIINGSINDDLRLLEVGPVVHSRWLTLACRILRFYVSQNRPTKALILLTKFCILVYLPSFFEIK